jgi:hypothetical protein
MKKRKQGTRLIKVECEMCGYVVRTTNKWLRVGRPTCCCGGKMLVDWDSAKRPENG